MSTFTARSHSSLRLGFAHDQNAGILSCQKKLSVLLLLFDFFCGRERCAAPAGDEMFNTPPHEVHGVCTHVWYKYMTTAAESRLSNVGGGGVSLRLSLTFWVSFKNSSHAPSVLITTIALSSTLGGRPSSSEPSRADAQQQQKKRSYKYIFFCERPSSSEHPVRTHNNNNNKKRSYKYIFTAVDLHTYDVNLYAYILAAREKHAINSRKKRRARF